MTETTETTEVRGIKEISEAVVFAISLGEAFDAALVDGQLGIEDIGLLVIPFTKAPDAIEGLDQVGAEIKDLDAAERGQLNQLVKDELNLSDDKLEAKIEAAVDFLAAIHTLLGALKA